MPESDRNGIVETDTLVPRPKPRRIRRGDTVKQLSEVRKQKEAGENINQEPEGFTEETIETILNASTDMILVVQRSSMEILAVNKAVEAKLDASYVDLNSLYPLFSQGTLLGIAAKNSTMQNQILTTTTGDDLFVDIETSSIVWCGQDALLLKVTEKDEEIAAKNSEAAIKVIEQLAAGIAHDVNNVFSVLLANLSLMEMDEAEDDKGKDYDIKEMIAATDRGTTLLKRFMRLTARIDLDLEKRDMYQFVHEMTNPLRCWQTKNDIEFRFVEAQGPCVCSFDVVQMSQVIQNLMKNSKDAMPAGGTITIAVRNIDLENTHTTPWKDALNQDSVCIYVEDDGTGIPQENLDDVFNPDFSTKRKTLNGYGLGLAVSKKIVENHGGRIFVESKTGEGSFTRFYIFLPKDS